MTSLVSGNGTYTLSNFTKLSNSINVNGVSLLVFFNDGVTANNRDIVIFDGNDSNISNPYDADNWNITLAGITYTSGTASMQLHVGDGQPYGDDAVILNASTLVPTDFDTVDGVFDGTTAQDPNAADPYLRLWDINSFNITSFLSPGPNTLTMSTGVYSDCLALVVAVIDLPAGAAPEQPTPTPTIPPTEPTATPVPQPTATPAPEPTATPVPPSNGGRMTGGGNVAIGSGKSAKKYTWGFELRCDGSAGNFEYQDHAQKLNFKLTGISGVICSDDSSISEGQPVAGFDTLYLSGTGKLNGVSGATIAVTLKDAGEPGVNDTIEISVSGTPGASTINKILTGGNHQAHPAG
ncbi:MAG: hypothetical protein HW403_149 [Dehalococcoidia bacterium]|nr:hypothetical protein [Dehalococcoidia bacterium]